jgi:hypothetical protein
MNVVSAATLATPPTADSAPAPLDAEALALDAGRLCLDFANTADWHASEQPVELLTSYADLVTWSRRARLLDDAETTTLL